MYEVTKDNPQKVTRIAELHNLNAKLDIHTLLKIMRSGERGVADEMFTIAKHERQYLVVIRHPQNKMSSQTVSINSISISAATCRRLMLEAIQLISGLHRMGLQMMYPIDCFVQITEGDQQHVIIPKLGAPATHDSY